MNKLNTEVIAEHIMGSYRLYTSEEDRNQEMKKVVIAVVRTRHESASHHDRAALIVTDHASGAVLFKDIVAEEWYYDDDAQDCSGRIGSVITIYDEHVTTEGFADGYLDNHEFRFETSEEHARFRELFLQAHELAQSYYSTLRKVLIGDVVSRGDHRPEITPA